MAKKPKAQKKRCNPIAKALAFHKAFRAKIVQDKRRKVKANPARTAKESEHA